MIILPIFLLIGSVNCLRIPVTTNARVPLLRRKAVEVFDFASIDSSARIAATTLFGLVPYFIFQLIAPKLGMVDANAEKIKEGEEPWK